MSLPPGQASEGTAGRFCKPFANHSRNPYPTVFGGRQSARSIHFLLTLSSVGFLVMHVTMVVATGFARNMNSIVMGTDAANLVGLFLELVSFLAVVS